jgi:hypothetical protein
LLFAAGYAAGGVGLPAFGARAPQDETLDRAWRAADERFGRIIARRLGPAIRGGTSRSASESSEPRRERILDSPMKR